MAARGVDDDATKVQQEAIAAKFLQVHGPAAASYRDGRVRQSKAILFRARDRLVYQNAELVNTLTLMRID